MLCDTAFGQSSPDQIGRPVDTNLTLLPGQPKPPHTVGSTPGTHPLTVVFITLSPTDNLTKVSKQCVFNFLLNLASVHIKEVRLEELHELREIRHT